ncbi:MAG: NADH-quinone oxidoreductase subunit NuoG [Alphaproteobacteria bacterium]|nr:NADH-quinone oxidoreductase subunit NuoG [Alphaproteobacteria bacterium]
MLQACEEAGKEIPRFCYHERLSIAGNCRMCLVEVKPGPPKPQASCALPVAEGQTIFTNTPMVKKAREGVMEFLLINHPLDCPICDQGGECDLQDQAHKYGSGLSRYFEHKRAVEDKYMGPLIKTYMTRCIQCTRCIRFAEEVAGTEVLGVTGRGEHMEVGTYVEQSISSEMSGNLIDLCPVGALTSKPYAFVSRPWELSKTETVDVMDAVGSNIRVDSRGGTVLRVLPRLNDDVNEEWISDKTRFACDGLRVQRLDRPYVRRDGKLQEATWDEAFEAVAAKVHKSKGERIAAIAGDMACAESMFAMKSLMTALDSANIDCRQIGEQIDNSNRASYIFNTTIAGIDDADFCLLIATNPRHEAPIINARLRKRYLQGNFAVASIGPKVDLTFPVTQLGNDPKILESLVAGQGDIVKKLKAAKNPMIILGSGALARVDGAAVLHAARALADKYNVVRDDWNGWNMLHHAASRVGALDLGFVPGKNGMDVGGMIDATHKKSLDMLFLLGVDEIDMSLWGNTFMVYIGHHGDAGAHRADVILPGAAYTEKDATYVNTEGRVQHTRQAVHPPHMAREDWKIIRALSASVGQTLPYNTLQELRQEMVKQVPHFATPDVIHTANWADFGAIPRGASKLTAESFEVSIRNFYMTDPISRASKTMAECTAINRDGGKNSSTTEAA